MIAAYRYPGRASCWESAVLITTTNGVRNGGKTSEEKIELKEIFLKYPFYGYRKQVLELEKEQIFSDGEESPAADA